MADEPLATSVMANICTAEVSPKTLPLAMVVVAKRVWLAPLTTVSA